MPPKPKKDDDGIISIDYDYLNHIVLSSGNVFEVVPGTYKEYKPHGSPEVFSVTAAAYGMQMVGPTSAIISMLFADPSTTE